MKPRLRNLRWIRQRKNLSQTDLAKLTGISQHSISKLETGQTAPRLETTQKLADALGVTPRALSGGGFGDVVTFGEILEAPADQRLDYISTLEELGDLSNFRAWLEQQYAEAMERYPLEEGHPEYIGAKMQSAMLAGYLMAYEEVRGDRGGGET